MQEVDIFKAIANERRLQVLDWLKDPRAHFRAQADGDLVEDGVCALLIAEKLGITGDATLAYAKEVVMADFEEAGDDDVFRKVRKDFDASGVAATDEEIRTLMINLMGKAVEQIKTGT